MNYQKRKMMNNKSHRENLRDKLQNGKYEEYKTLSVCKINDFYRLVHRKIRYQVHSDGRYKFSELYEDIEEAMDKYFEIRRRMR